MSIDIEEVRREEKLWHTTMQLRWRRPKRATDQDIILEQLWERATGERQWRTVPTLLED